MNVDTGRENHGLDKSQMIETLKSLPLFVTVKVGDLLFGYRDATLEMISEVEEKFRSMGFTLVLPDSIRNGQYSIMAAVSFLF